MAKSQKHLRQIVENTSEIGYHPFERDIPLNKTYRIFSKQSLKYSDLETSEITIPIRKVKTPDEYALSNLPISKERALMQDYHFCFSQGDLKQMVTSPKVLIDQKHLNLISRKQLVSKTNFFMVSPQLQNTGLPTIYRLSVSRYVDNPQHYSISLHAVVGGCVDGFLFLGRFDNNNECNHIVKPDKAVLKNDIQFTLTAGNSMTNQHFHEIGFPHIHLADANYACGSIPEKVTPKFVEKCKNNNFEENIEYIMHLFGISHYHNFYKQDEKLLTVLDESKKFAVLRDDRKTDVITDVIRQNEIRDKTKITPNDVQGTAGYLLR